ncbi:MAG: helix-turn-helix transcriptional regulator [Oscillospiraceae bacterium]|nr:helix-turn-helix transcriptional regulator [Oscillospiraceae bacterium]
MDGSSERMCYSGGSPFSFLSVSMPVERFAGVIGDYMPEPDRLIEQLNGRRFAISAAIQRELHEIGPLELVHGGFEMMRLDARLLESLSLCMQAGLCEPVRRSSLHREDLAIIRAIGKRIEDDPATVPDIAALAREACMSVSKLTRSFRQVYGTSLHAYVMEVRLQKGAELLMNDEISIQEIAELVGYNKPSQFSADFRRRFGILPGEYRLRG